MTRIRSEIYKIIIFLGIYFSFSLNGYNQEKNPDYDLFKSRHILKVHLTFHIDSLLNNRNVDTIDHLGTLTYFGTGGKSTDFSVIVKMRGNFRRNPDNCSFPPLRLGFLTDNSEDTLFRGLEWLKLVTHCQTDSTDFEQLILQEYLLYKTYNIISPFSFNVRLLDIKYIDSSGSGTIIQSYGFFIERPKQMAQRNGGELVKTDVMLYKNLDETSLIKLSLFQYMIWNNDWSVPLFHNVKFVKTTMGICLKKKKLIPFLEFYFSKKDEIYNLYRDFPYLDETQKERTLKMYDDFYSLIKKPGKANSKFKENCFSK